MEIPISWKVLRCIDKYEQLDLGSNPFVVPQSMRIKTGGITID